MEIFIITGKRCSGKSYFINRTIPEKTILTLYSYERKYLSDCYNGCFVQLNNVYSTVINNPAIIEYDYPEKFLRYKIIKTLKCIKEFSNIRLLYIITPEPYLQEVLTAFPDATLIEVSRRVTP